MNRPQKALRLKPGKRRKAAVFATSSINKKYRKNSGRVLTIKINNELSPRGEAVNIKLEQEREEMLKKTKFMDEKFAELLQLVNSK
jgi:hypothetical protein